MWRAEVEQTLESCKKDLSAVRERRPRPHLDDKIITAWCVCVCVVCLRGRRNGLMIGALARGFQVLEDDRYLFAAIKARWWYSCVLMRWLCLGC